MTPQPERFAPSVWIETDDENVVAIRRAESTVFGCRWIVLHARDQRGAR